MTAEVIVAMIVVWSGWQVLRPPSRPARRHTHTVSRVAKR